MKVRYVLYSAVLLAIGGLLGYERWFENRLVQERSAAVKASEKRWAETKIGEASPDLLGPPSFRHTPPPSAWRSGEKSFYENLLARGRFDILVVPFQVEGYGIDRGTRSFMTARLAMAIAGSGATVPDPYLVSRALGDGERRLQPTEIARVARRLGVQRIVMAYVGHDASWNLSVRLQHGDPATIMQPTGSNTHFFSARFSDDNPPIEAYQSLLPKILTAVGFDPAVLRPLAKGEAPALATLPATPLGMTSGPADPARDAYFLQLLALLTPEAEERTRERFTERSLLAVLSLSPESPDYGILKARAYSLMGLRAAALKALGTPASAEGRHLFALLNGNQPEVERLAPEVPPQAKALIARLEANRLGFNYGSINQDKSTRIATSLDLPSPVWKFFARRGFTDPHLWIQHDNVALKRLLEQELPVEGFSLDELARGAASLGDSGKAEALAHLSVLNHIRKLIEIEAAKLCCQPLAARATRNEYLEFVEALATDNLARRADFLGYIQGVPEKAMEFLAQVDSVFKDHPRFALSRAQAEVRLAAKAEGTAKEGLLNSAYNNALNAMYWEQGATRTAQEARSVLYHRGRNAPLFFANDYPYRPFYAHEEGPRGIATASSALHNSSFDTTPVEELYRRLGQVQNDWAGVEEVLKQVEGRFAGHSIVPILKARMSIRRGEMAEAEAHYRAAIAAQPTRWNGYMYLGRLLFEQAKPEKAAEVFASYPGFKSRDGADNAVALSNYAYEAGSLFYWSGHVKWAVPLHKIAADLDTGSEASLIGTIRLALLDGDYATAVSVSFQRAKRYNTSLAYRDYFGLMHAMGNDSIAWDGFATLIRQADWPVLWETALVGHRMAAADESQIATWISRHAPSPGQWGADYGGLYLLRAAITDRLPSKSFAADLARVELPVLRIKPASASPEQAAALARVVRVSPDGQTYFVLGPAIKWAYATPARNHAGWDKEPVKSHFAYFAEAYRAIHRRDFATARVILEEAATLYGLGSDEGSYLLPYLAFAGAKSGNVSFVEGVLDKFTEEQRRFDYHLAKAAIYAVAGNAREAERSLQLALHRRSFTVDRPPYAEYQFAELCEWLYEATRHTKYHDLALDWARKNQLLQPWFAWPYAMEAKLSKNPKERRRAMAMAYYLDKNSARLASLPAAEVKSAVREFGHTNPFQRAAAPVKQERI